MTKFNPSFNNIKTNMTNVMGNRYKPNEGSRWTNRDGRTLVVTGHSNGNYKAEVRWSNGDTEYLQWDLWTRLEEFDIA